jgi:hypothetical protein
VPQGKGKERFCFGASKGKELLDWLAGFAGKGLGIWMFGRKRKVGFYDM